MNSFKVKFGLLSIWLAGLLFCLVVLLTAYKDIPNYFGKVLNQVIDTFSPQLATMLAFVFSDEVVENKQKSVNKYVASFALIISAVYVLFFCYIMLGFQLEKYNASQAIELFDSIRPKTSFLVVGIIVYFFASRKNVSRKPSNR